MSEEISIKSKKTQRVKLAKHESNFSMLLLPPFTTITLYQGNISYKYIYEQVSLIIKKNQWLCGNLVKKKDSVFIEYAQNPDKQSINRCIKKEVDVGLRNNLTPFELNQLASQHLVEMGRNSVNKEQAIFKVTVIENPQASENVFAIVVSMNHMVGDGATLYNVYGMMGNPKKIRSLEVNRFESFEIEKAHILGSEEARVAETTGFFLSLLKTTLFKRNPDACMQYVNADWINNSKVQHSTDKKFISTNDILTSWLINSSQAKCFLMDLDLRKRINGLHSDYAGNYNGYMFYYKEDVEGPIDVRKSLSNMRRNNFDIHLTPKNFSSMIYNWANITNISTLYQDLQFPGCFQLVHFPVGELKTVPFLDYVMVFCSTPNKIGLTCVSRSITPEAFDKDKFTQAMSFTPGNQFNGHKSVNQ